jgi:hypothetical protein
MVGKKTYLNRFYAKKVLILRFFVCYVFYSGSVIEAYNDLSALYVSVRISKIIRNEYDALIRVGILGFILWLCSSGITS